MNKKTLITGGNGFIGSHLNVFLINNGYDVEILKDDVKNSLKTNYKADIVVHLAGKNEGSKDYIKENNVRGTLNVLEFCKDNHAKLLFVSTVGVYGNPLYIPIDENHPPKPTNSYSKSKLEAEILCKDFSDRYGIEVTVLRLANVYGMGQKAKFLIPSILESIKKNKEIKINSPGDIKRDFVYIDDILDAFLKCINFKRNNFEVFNIGSGYSVSIAEIIKIFAETLNKKLKINYLNLKKDEVKDICIDYSKAKSLLNWSPKIGIKEGINYILFCGRDGFP